MTSTLRRRTAMKVAGLAALVGLASSTGGGSRAVQRRPQSDRARGRDSFTVAIDGEEVTGWRSVTIPASTTEEGEYREGDEPDHDRRIWGQTTFVDLEMERGVQPGDSRMFEWREAVRMGKLDEGRKELTVTWRGDDGTTTTWEFEEAWIKAYDPPELSGSDGDVATESVTVAFDRMVRTEA